MITQNKNITFSVLEAGAWIPDNCINICYLRKYNWDDFGFCTYFQVYFIDENRERKELESVSIASKGRSRPLLPDINL
jgi:hypothetical protein